MVRPKAEVGVMPVTTLQVAFEGDLLGRGSCNGGSLGTVVSMGAPMYSLTTFIDVSRWKESLPPKFFSSISLASLDIVPVMLPGTIGFLGTLEGVAFTDRRITVGLTSDY